MADRRPLGDEVQTPPYTLKRAFSLGLSPTPKRQKATDSDSPETQRDTHLSPTIDNDFNPLLPPAISPFLNASSHPIILPPHTRPFPVPQPWPTFSMASDTVPVLFRYFPVSRLIDGLPALYIITPAPLPRMPHTLYHEARGVHMDSFKHSKAWDAPIALVRKWGLFTTYAIELTAQKRLTIDLNKHKFFSIPVAAGFLPGNDMSVEEWVSGIDSAQVDEVEQGRSLEITVPSDLIDAVLLTGKDNLAPLYTLSTSSELSCSAATAPLPPTIIVEKIPLKSPNILQPHLAPETHEQELSVGELWRSSITLKIYRAISFLPRLLYRLQHASVVEGLSHVLFDDVYDVAMLREALTAEWPEAGLDYEWWEFIGDALAGLVVVLFRIAFLHERTSENAFKIVSNKGLLVIVQQTKLALFACHIPFIPQIWRIWHDFEAQSALGVGIPITVLDEKPNVDILEASLGALALSGPLERVETTAIPTMKALKFPLNNLNGWEDFELGWNRMPLEHLYSAAAKLPLSTVEALQILFKRSFGERDLGIIRGAFLYRPGNVAEKDTWARFKAIGIESLKFYSVMHVSKHLCERTETLVNLNFIKAHMMSRSVLAAVCVTHGLHDFLLDVPKPVMKKIKAYKIAHSTATRDGLWWMDLPSVKILPDLMQRLMGALFVINKFRIQETYQEFSTLILSFHDWGSFLELARVSQLQPLFVLCQLYKCYEFEYKLSDTTDPGFPFKSTGSVYNRYVASAHGTSEIGAYGRVTNAAIKVMDEHRDELLAGCDCGDDDDVEMDIGSVGEMDICAIDEMDARTVDELLMWHGSE